MINIEEQTEDWNPSCLCSYKDFSQQPCIMTLEIPTFKLSRRKNHRANALNKKPESYCLIIYIESTYNCVFDPVQGNLNEKLDVYTKQ